ncbi:hypothetical protein [Salinifilum ghardaiensis]
MNSTPCREHPAPQQSSPPQQPPPPRRGADPGPAPAGGAAGARGALRRIAGVLLRTSAAYASLARNHPMK